MTNDKKLAYEQVPNWSALDAPFALRGNSLVGRDFLRLLDLSPGEFHGLLSTTIVDKLRWKADAANEQGKAPSAGRAVGIILEKPSLRTRVSFERAVSRLGAQPIVE
jgi:ornithine carbamoyltransferase